jgi:hypothetical protein
MGRVFLNHQADETKNQSLSLFVIFFNDPKETNGGFAGQGVLADPRSAEVVCGQ